jgi:hypothetical protein
METNCYDGAYAHDNARQPAKENRRSGAGPAHRRAEVTSSFFVVPYVAKSLPVIGLGIAVQLAGIQRATLLFVGLTIVIVLIALLLLMRGQANREPDVHAIGD